MDLPSFVFAISGSFPILPIKCTSFTYKFTFETLPHINSIIFLKKNKVDSFFSIDYYFNVNFLQNSLARRAAVQAIYRNHFYWECNADFFLKYDEFLVGHVGNEDLFCEIFNECIFLWKFYDRIFEFLCFNKSSKSLVAVSIFKVFLAEFFLCKTDYKILLKEYLILLDLFCSTDASVMRIHFNKVIEQNLISKKDDFTTIDESSNI